MVKKISCFELGGACDLEFFGDTFEEVQDQSHEHGMEMWIAKDACHMPVMEKMAELMKDKEAFDKFMRDRQDYFNNLDHQ